MTTRKGLPRWLWELLILMLIGAIGYGAWWWMGIEHSGELQAQRDAAAERYEPRIKALEGQIRAATATEATATATAFAAGISALAAEQRWIEVDRAALEILELPGLAFVHVIGTDGTVKVSSDRKMLAVGEVGSQGRWALGATGVTQRNSPTDLVEIAVPMGAGDQQAILWLGYRSMEPEPATATETPAQDADTPTEGESGS